MDIYEMLRAEAKAKKTGEPVKEQYGRISVDLSTARTDEELHISGNQITIAQCDGGATTTYFKLNSKHSRKVYPAEITKVLGNFGGVFLTNAAEPGKTLTIYLGRDIFIFPARAEANRILKADGTTINPAREETLEEVKTAVEFSGNVFSKQQISTNALVAVGSVKLRDVVIKNSDGANAVDLGETAGTVGAFRGASLELAAGASIGFTQVDLATLFILSSVADSHAAIQVLGVEI